MSRRKSITRLPASNPLSLLILAAAALFGQVPICDLLNDLQSAEGRQLLIAGDLIRSKHISPRPHSLRVAYE